MLFRSAANPDVDWSQALLASNQRLMWYRAMLYSNEPRDYFDLSLNPYITYEFVRRQKKRLDHFNLSCNSAITWEMAQLFHADYECLSTNPNITWAIVAANPNKRWNYTSMLGNPNITWDIIQTKLASLTAVDYRILSFNPSLTWDVIREQPWNYNNLSANPFTKDPTVRRRLIMGVVWRRWRAFVTQEKAIKAEWRVVYGCVLHELAMRWRDARRCPGQN